MKEPNNIYVQISAKVALTIRSGQLDPKIFNDVADLLVFARNAEVKEDPQMETVMIYND